MKYRHILILTALANFSHLSQGQDGPPEGWVSSVSSGYLHQSNSDLADFRRMETLTVSQPATRYGDMTFQIHPDSEEQLHGAI
ncbi:MAG: hypothetical protein ACKVGW_10925 [Verrucomicrobiia bacterium]